MEDVDDIKSVEAHGDAMSSPEDYEDDDDENASTARVSTHTTTAPTTQAPSLHALYEKHAQEVPEHIRTLLDTTLTQWEEEEEDEKIEEEAEQRQLLSRVARGGGGEKRMEKRVRLRVVRKNELEKIERIRVESLLILEDLSPVEKDILRRKGLRTKEVGVLYVVKMMERRGCVGERGLVTAEALLQRDPRRFLAMHERVVLMALGRSKPKVLL